MANARCGAAAPSRPPRCTWAGRRASTTSRRRGRCARQPRTASRAGHGSPTGVGRRPRRDRARRRRTRPSRQARRAGRPGSTSSKTSARRRQRPRKRVVNGARALIDAVNAAANGGGESRSVDIPQPLEGRISRAHNLQRERTFVPLRVKDPVDQAERRCEHFAEYGSAAHALSYFRGNENIPAVCDPILKALLKEEAVDVARREPALETNAERLQGLDGRRPGGGGRRALPLAHGSRGERRDHGHLHLARAGDHGVRAARGRSWRPDAHRREAGNFGAAVGRRAVEMGPPRDAPSRRRGEGADCSRARVRGVGVLRTPPSGSPALSATLISAGIFVPPDTPTRSGHRRHTRSEIRATPALERDASTPQHLAAPALRQLGQFSHTRAQH